MSKAVTTAEFTSDLPASLGSAGKVLTVNSGATAFGWGDAFAYPTGAAAGQVLQRNAGNSAYEWGDGLPTGASAGQVLQRNAGDSAYEWGTISTGYDVVFPSNWASPTTTYTSSGTWSKGSLSDDDYVWIYLIGGGGGGGDGNAGGAGGRSAGGNGGRAIHIYGKAGVLNGATYVIGAGKTGGTGSYPQIAPNDSTFTLTANNGGTVFNTLSQYGRFITTGGSKATVDLAAHDDFVSFAKGSASYTFTDVLPTGVVRTFLANGLHISEVVSARPFHSVFSGGGGGGVSSQGIGVGDNSEFAGNGGDGSTTRTTTNGVYPGGGGAGSRAGLAGGGNGAAGNMRDYHV